VHPLIYNLDATKHRIGYIGVQIMLLLDMTQYKVVKGKKLGSVLVKQFSLALPEWGLGRGRDPPQNIIRLRCVRRIRCDVSSHSYNIANNNNNNNNNSLADNLLTFETKH